MMKKMCAILLEFATDAAAGSSGYLIWIAPVELLLKIMVSLGTLVLIVLRIRKLLKEEKTL